MSFHDRPAVYINQHLFWGLMSVGIGCLNPAVRFILQRQFCLLKVAHWALAFHALLQASEQGLLPI